MINRSPRCVFVADKVGLADVLAAWLGEHGIAADVMDTATLGGFEGKVSITPWVASARGIEVWVREDSDVERANALLTEKFAEIQELQSRRAQRSGNIETVCEECGTTSSWPASAGGTIERCPHCDEYLDVPDPDEPSGASEDLSPPGIDEEE